jgi:hypothetical protein
MRLVLLGFCAGVEGWIEIDEFAAIEIRQVLSVRRPGDALGQLASQRTMRVNGLNGKRFRRGLSRKGKRCG